MFVMREEHWRELRELDIPHKATALWRRENGLGPAPRERRAKPTRAERLNDMLEKLPAAPRPRRKR